MRIRLSIFSLLLFCASMASAAWDSLQRHNGYGHMASNGGFGFSMGFGGRSNNHFGNSPIILHGVNFEYDSARLTPESSTVLDVVARRLRSVPDLTVEIGGHASAEGEDSYNLDLSQRRAEAVREFLIEAGVAADNMSASGYGETRPLVSNTSETGRSLNRRVELLRL